MNRKKLYLLLFVISFLIFVSEAKSDNPNDMIATISTLTAAASLFGLLMKLDEDKQK